MKVISAEELFSMNKTEEILESKASEINRKFYHYTSFESVKNILQPDERGNRFFFLRNIKDMNDLNEAELHEQEAERVHVFCTCCTNHEKIPLWYLYSGICGQGARIGIPPGKLLDLMKSISVLYPVRDGKADYSCPLTIGKDFDLYCGWVYYIMDGNNRVFYKKGYLDVEPLNKEIMQKVYFIKDYPWEYEREFRVVIKNKTKENYGRLAVPIPSKIIPYFEIMSAPEGDISEERRKDLVSLGIQENRLKSSKLKIRMNLLKNNREDILRQLDLLKD